MWIMRLAVWKMYWWMWDQLLHLSGREVIRDGRLKELWLEELKAIRHSCQWARPSRFPWGFGSLESWPPNPSSLMYLWWCGREEAAARQGLAPKFRALESRPRRPPPSMAWVTTLPSNDSNSTPQRCDFGGRKLSSPLGPSLPDIESAPQAQPG